MTTTIKVPAEVLRRAATLAKLASDARSHIPALAHGRLEVSNGTATLTSTDLDTWIDVRFPAACADVEPVLLDLAALVKRLPAKGEVELAYADGAWWIVTGSRRLRVPHMDASVWPESRPDTGTISNVIDYDGPALRAAFEHVHRAVQAVGAGDDRLPLQNVLLDDTGCAVATDGHRLHWVKGLPEAPGWRVPGTTAGILLDVFRQIDARGHVRLTGFTKPATKDAHHVTTGLRFETSVDDRDIVVACKMPEAEFPRWRQVLGMHDNGVQVVTFQGPALLAELLAFKRAGVPEGLRDAVHLRTDGTMLVVEAHSFEDCEEARTEITTASPRNLDKVAVGAPYLRDALAAANGSVTATRREDEEQALVLDLGNGRHAILMPKKM